VLTQPPYALASVVFRFRALAALAGRLPLGGERELVMALWMGARLADGCTAREQLPGPLRKARVSAARHWIAALSLGVAARSAANQLAESSGGESREQVIVSLERLVTLVQAQLDPPSRTELRQLIAALRAT